MITGQQARELLNGTTPGPWEFFHDEWGHNDDGEARFEQWGVIGGSDGIMSTSPCDSLFGADNGLVDEHDHAANLTLAAAAPALAETVAWLYGREADDEAVWDDHYEVSITADKRVAVFDHDATTTFFTPDEAIEFARALLAAAEQARHE